MDSSYTNTMYSHDESEMAQPCHLGLYGVLQEECVIKGDEDV